MHFSHLHQGGNKAGKLALVGGAHVVLGALLVHGLQTKTFTFSDPPPVVMLDPVTPRPMEPPPPPSKPANLPPPQLVVPVVEIPVTPPEQTDTVQARRETDVARPPAATDPAGPPVPPADPPVAPARPARMHTAVFADANACALPAYPARSARNGDTGTTILALLVGADGRVGSARVERSSGFRELDRAAVEALSLCRFKPATTNGVPEAAWAQLGYVWTLD